MVSYALYQSDSKFKYWQSNWPLTDALRNQLRSIIHRSIVNEKSIYSDFGICLMDTSYLLSAIQFDVTTFVDDLIRLTLAILLGGLVGAERELSGQSAGLRTHVMVALGSAVFTLAGIATAGGDLQQVTRVVQGVAAGVGFLGAGAILKLDGDTKVRGLTTAGSIWVAAAMGTAAGLGEYALAASATIAALVVLVVLRPLSKRLDRYAKQLKKNPME